jgi:hypothetical protein
MADWRERSQVGTQERLEQQVWLHSLMAAQV